MQRQNDQLKAQNKEILDRVEIMTREIKSLQDNNQTLLSINDIFGNENDQLNAELEKYRSVTKKYLTNE